MDDAYRVQLIWEYNHNVKINHLKEAWESAQSRYGSLRLRFAWDEELVQIIDRDGSLDWRYLDLSHEEQTTQDFKIREIQEEDRRRAFDLEEGSLFRIIMIKQKEDFYTCLFSSHHAILDGWSNPILLGYVHDTYLKICNGERVLKTREYIYEESQKYIEEHEQENQEYWEGYVSKIEERADLSGLLKSDQRSVRLRDYKHIKESQEQTLEIEERDYKELKELGQREGVTLNVILQYVWHKILSIYGHTKQTVVGTTVSGRSIPINDIEKSVGLYINTLPLIVNHEDKMKEGRSILDSIKEIQENINEMNARSDVSLASLQSDGERLFDCTRSKWSSQRSTDGAIRHVFNVDLRQMWLTSCCKQDKSYLLLQCLLL